MISGVPVDTLAISAVHSKSNAQVKSTVAITQPGSTVVQNLTLLSLSFPQNFGHMEGQVFHADGVTPAANIPVYTSLGGTAVTDASGSYHIENIPVGEAMVRAIDQARLEEATIRTSVIASRTVTANLLLYGGSGTVKGSVMDSDGNALAGASIYGGYTVVQTDENGAFTLTDIPVGNRQISALIGTDSLQQTNVNITRPGEEVFVTIIFPVRGTLTGTVYRADGSTPVTDLKLFALGPKNDLAYTNAQGQYRFEGMPKGDYTISAFWPDFSDGNMVKSKIVFKDEVRVVNVIFRGKGTVQGTIYDDDGVTPLGRASRLARSSPN